MMMRFSLEIELGTSATLSATDVAGLLHKTSRRLAEGDTGQAPEPRAAPIIDFNGNAVGRWEFADVGARHDAETPYLKQSPHASERGLHEPPIPLGELRDRLEADAPSGDHGTLDDALQRAMELRTELATINFHGLAEAQLPVVSDAIDMTATVILRVEAAIAIDDDLHPEENDPEGENDEETLQVEQESIDYPHGYREDD